MSNTPIKTDADIFAVISPDGGPVSLNTFIQEANRLYATEALASMTAPKIQENIKSLMFSILVIFKESLEHPAERICSVTSVFQKDCYLFPIIEVTLPNNNGTLTLYDDMFSLIISCDLQRPLPNDIFGVVGHFVRDEDVDPRLCTAMPQDKLFACFAENTQKFTVRQESLCVTSSPPVIIGLCRVLRDLPPMPDTLHEEQPFRSAYNGNKYKMRRE